MNPGRASGNSQGEIASGALEAKSAFAVNARTPKETWHCEKRVHSL